MVEVGSAEADVTTADDDAQLAERLRARTTDACAELYDRYATGVHRFAMARLGGDVEAAEDIVVETMVGVVTDIGRFQASRSSLAAWVYGIARRRVLLELRKGKRRKSVPPEAQVSAEEIGELSNGADVAEGVTSRLAATRQVVALREITTAVEFEVLVLSCVEELSAQEVGQVIRRSERAVHSILHRAKTKARGRLVRDE
jgi:RNA polymerase sigma-70 factor (ECF subfamily)